MTTLVPPGVKNCKPDQILNPKSGRCVNKNGPTGRKLLKQYTTNVPQQQRAPSPRQAMPQLVIPESFNIKVDYTTDSKTDYNKLVKVLKDLARNKAPTTSAYENRNGGFVIGRDGNQWYSVFVTLSSEYEKWVSLWKQV